MHVSIHLDDVKQISGIRINQLKIFVCRPNICAGQPFVTAKQIQYDFVSPAAQIRTETNMYPVGMEGYKKMEEYKNGSSCFELIQRMHNY